MLIHRPDAAIVVRLTPDMLEDGNRGGQVYIHGRRPLRTVRVENLEHEGDWIDLTIDQRVDDIEKALKHGPVRLLIAMRHEPEPGSLARSYDWSMTAGAPRRLDVLMIDTEKHDDGRWANVVLRHGNIDASGKVIWANGIAQSLLARENGAPIRVAVDIGPDGAEEVIHHDMPREDPLAWHYAEHLARHGSDPLYGFED